MAPAEKHVTLAYAATASLAAVTLVYVFAPTWFIDSTSSSSKDRKRCVVGLVNPANDCFVGYTLSGKGSSGGPAGPTATEEVGIEQYIANSAIDQLDPPSSRRPRRPPLVP